MTLRSRRASGTKAGADLHRKKRVLGRLTETPWVAYGQTKISANSTIDNPPSSRNGVLGEADLPFTVPGGKVLVIDVLAVEAYDVPGTIVLIPWIGADARNETLLMSCAATAGTRTCRVEYRLPPGAVLNVRLQSTQQTGHGGAVHAWHIGGRLIDV
jgi:hypothetical protein